MTTQNRDFVMLLVAVFGFGWTPPVQAQPTLNVPWAVTFTEDTVGGAPTLAGFSEKEVNFSPQTASATAPDSIRVIDNGGGLEDKPLYSERADVNLTPPAIDLANATAITSGVVRVEWDAAIVSGDANAGSGSAQWRYLQAVSFMSNNGVKSSTVIYRQTSATGGVVRYTGGGAQQLQPQFTIGVPQHFVAELDLGRGTCSIWVNGTLMADKVADPGGMSNFRGVRFSSSDGFVSAANEGVFASVIDNIKVTVLPSAAIEGAVVNIVLYGANGDDSSDDTSSIQSAIAALNPNGGDVLYFPRGLYYVSASLNVPSGTMVLGQGLSASRIKNTVNNSPVFLFTSSRTGLYFKNISLESSRGTAIQHTGGTLADCYFENLTLSGGSGGDSYAQGCGFSSTDLRSSTFTGCILYGGPRYRAPGTELPTGNYGSGIRIAGTDGSGTMNGVVVARCKLLGAPALYIDVSGTSGRSLFLCNTVATSGGGMIRVVNGRDLTFRQWGSEGMCSRVSEPAIWVQPGGSHIAFENVTVSYLGPYEQRPTVSYLVEGNHVLLQHVMAGDDEGSVNADYRNPAAVQASGDYLWVRNSVFSQRLEESGEPLQRVYQGVQWKTPDNLYMPMKVRHGVTLEDWVADPNQASGETLAEFTPFDMEIPAPPAWNINRAALAASIPGAVNVADYGADPAWGNDDTQAIRNAIAALPSTSGGLLYFPAGVYTVSEPIDFSQAPGNQYWILGDGMGRTIIQGASGYAGDLFQFSWLPADETAGVSTSRNYYTFEDFTLRKAVRGLVGMEGTLLSYCFMQRIAFERLALAGIDVAYLDTNDSIVDCHFLNSPTGRGFNYEWMDIDYKVTGISHLHEKTLNLRNLYANLEQGAFCNFVVGSAGTVGNLAYRDCLFNRTKGPGINWWGAIVMDGCDIINCGAPNGTSAARFGNGLLVTLNNIVVDNTDMEGATYLLEAGFFGLQTVGNPATGTCGYGTCRMNVRDVALYGNTVTGVSMIDRVGFHSFYGNIVADQGVERYTTTKTSLLYQHWQNCSWNQAGGTLLTDDLLLRRGGQADIDYVSHGYVP